MSKRDPNDPDAWRDAVAKPKRGKIRGLPSVKAAIDDGPERGRTWDEYEQDAYNNAWQALNGPRGLVERVTGKRPGLLEALDPDDTSFEELFGYTPGDQ
jgi:hypothetical protein